MERGSGYQAMLAKIDRLRELNVGSMIPLPQLVVVGDQSSGKSSVLESLTGFSFPRGTGLCTRYATQITCCRDALSSVAVSIIPRPDADDELKAKLLAFRRELTEICNDELTKIFQDANAAMGIRMGSEDSTSGAGAFSEDILKIEIYGPDQDHLTVIDVPGIFPVPTPGLTTEMDIKLVENMVKRYMDNSRTIILAVMPCNVDIATQEIPKLAKAADPEGIRTMGVLTKPDLALEKATRGAVLDLRTQAEKVFFSSPEWVGVIERCGVYFLKERLRHLLVRISKEEFPNVKADIDQRLRRAETALEGMGPARADHGAQRLYLGRIATRFQAITTSALSGHYAGNDIFKDSPRLKLITRIMRLHTTFSHVFAQSSHLQKFDAALDEAEELGTCALPFEIDLEAYSELQDIIVTEEYKCPDPVDKPIIDEIRETYQASRGPELGTFGGTVLSSVAIVLVHDYINVLLETLCPEEEVCSQLWQGFLVERLVQQYRQAMSHARFLLSIERKQPATFNHYFNHILQKKRSDRFTRAMEKLAINCTNYNGTNDTSLECVPLHQLRNGAETKDNEEQVCEDVLDTFTSYYKVARKRFVDVVYQQAIWHYLLADPEGPLKVFDADMVMRLTDEQLEEIAGEGEESKQRRASLSREVESLKAALRVIRS
ncbi:interferon-induced GTP-binding protein Mx1 [Purpureocillium lilacinum]|uniref:Interferon-induced GTP-binding protein Mx1 n=1 Tax=Purpureocillium lilacinum TaxID=33203 RepID=A0A179EWP7_PURLI|nr:interferon-induced GTP-binding protein Mx1 [Purpureocillium lilacinum]OAQ57591.1 interferon-induced GTP-binding protein Mx1 [Purpureocillium lilacinum]